MPLILLLSKENKFEDRYNAPMPLERYNQTPTIYGSSDLHKDRVCFGGRITFLSIAYYSKFLNKLITWIQRYAQIPKINGKLKQARHGSIYMNQKLRRMCCKLPHTKQKGMVVFCIKVSFY